VVLCQVRGRPIVEVCLSVACWQLTRWILYSSRRYGGPSVLQMGELPDAELRGPSDVVVQVHAVALNPVCRHLGA